MLNRLAAIFLAFLMAVPAAAAELLMIEQMGCVYCETWDEEIAPIYPKTAESTFAPLRRIDIFDPALDDIELARAVNFTPTFVLLQDNVELDRIEGYPGEDFFWGLLDMMLERHTDFGGGS